MFAYKHNRRQKAIARKSGPKQLSNRREFGEKVHTTSFAGHWDPTKRRYVVAVHVPKGWPAPDVNALVAEEVTKQRTRQSSLPTPSPQYQLSSVDGAASQHIANHMNHEQTIPNANDRDAGSARPGDEDGLEVDMLQEPDATLRSGAEDATRCNQNEGEVQYQRDHPEISGWEQLPTVCGEPVHPNGISVDVSARPTQPFPGQGTLEGSQHTMASFELWPTRGPEPSRESARRIMMDSGRPFYPLNSIRALMEWLALGRECLVLMNDILASGPKEHQMALERESLVRLDPNIAENGPRDRYYLNSLRMQ